jgi:thiamine-monophosphate kinase
VTEVEAPATLADLGESGLLRTVFARLARSTPACSRVALGPGDDAAYVRSPGGVLVTTDAMVRGRDWRDAWSSASDVGAKLVAQNLADVSAMGGVGTSLLVSLVAPPSTTVQWLEHLVDGIAEGAARAEVTVAGGDLSSSHGEVSVTVTALGELPAGVHAPVLRSGACPGDVVAVSGELGRSAAGLEVLRRSDSGWYPVPEHASACAQWVGYHCRPDPDHTQGPVAARAGATSLIDISDGLVRDAGRVAAASRVQMRLWSSALSAFVEPVARVLGAESAKQSVWHGGEEHVLLGTFSPESVPPGWTELGQVSAADQRTEQPGQVWLDDALAPAGGWDHFER